MGISLTGLTPATTYDALIKVGDNGPLTASLKVISDGLGTNLPMEASTTGINFTGALQQSGVAVPTASQVAAKQDTLVSGTNIKTINGTSVLGSGNIAVVTSPSGVAGAIQFSNGSAFASDASNLFWDDTNNRLGIGTNAPSATGHFQGAGDQLWATNSGDIYTYLKLSANGGLVSMTFGDGNGTVNYLNNYAAGMWASNKFAFGPSLFTPSGQVHIKGSGSTSATTSLLVQNSAGRQIARATDNGLFQVGTADLSGALSQPFAVTATSGNNANMALYAQGGDNAGFDFYRNGAFKFNVGIGGGSDNFAWFNLAYGNYSFYILSDATGRTIFGGTTGDASAQVAIDSTTRGFLPPRMTTTQKNAIATPAAGLIVYDNTTNKLQCYNGSTWNDLF